MSHYPFLVWKYPMSSSDSTALVNSVWTAIVLPRSLSENPNVLMHSLFPHPAGPTTNICNKTYIGFKQTISLHIYVHM